MFLTVSMVIYATISVFSNETIELNAKRLEVNQLAVTCDNGFTIRREFELHYTCYSTELGVRSGMIENVITSLKREPMRFHVRTSNDEAEKKFIISIHERDLKAFSFFNVELESYMDDVFSSVHEDIIFKVQVLKLTRKIGKPL